MRVPARLLRGSAGAVLIAGCSGPGCFPFLRPPAYRPYFRRRLCGSFPLTGYATPAILAGVFANDNQNVAV